MQPDRLVELFHQREKRFEFGKVERLAGDVGVDLHAERAVLHRPFRFGDAGVGRAERALRHPAGEMIAILGADLGKAVIDGLGV